MNHPILPQVLEPTPGAPLRIGRYEVLNHLATGGMAQIYLARQTGLGEFERYVVLKTILRERASDQRFITMFLDEAKLAATLNHQNIAQVYEVDQADGQYYMAMEYVHGENARAILETTLRRGWTIPLELALMMMTGAAAGLHHAHERKNKQGQPLNIVHRDVSPANIMVGYDGSVKVLDFGIAKAEERATKTVGGTIKGKYGYMSPEQCKGKSIDRRSDIFALGICLYELTTLRRAFKGADDFETMKRIVAGDVLLPSVVVPGYPRELEAIILTAMANDPNARFQTAQEMIEALDAFAVRTKLTGSSTALGRFMTQVFGPQRELGTDGGGSDRTQVSSPEMREDADNVKTVVLQVRDQARQLQSTSTPTSPDPAAWQQQEPRSRARTPTPRLSQPRLSLDPAPAALADAQRAMPLHAPITHPGQRPSSGRVRESPPPMELGALAQPRSSSPTAPRVPAVTGAHRLPSQRRRSVFRRAVLILIVLVTAGIAAGIGVAQYQEHQSSSSAP